jgi:hypothetical protein
MDVFTSILGRASQGIINGVLAAYVTRGSTALWHGALAGGAIGVGLGALAGIPDRVWMETIPLGGVIGVACGIATARARR